MTKSKWPVFKPEWVKQIERPRSRFFEQQGLMRLSIAALGALAVIVGLTYW